MIGLNEVENIGKGIGFTGERLKKKVWARLDYFKYDLSEFSGSLFSRQ